MNSYRGPYEYRPRPRTQEDTDAFIAMAGDGKNLAQCALALDRTHKVVRRWANVLGLAIEAHQVPVARHVQPSPVEYYEPAPVTLPFVRGLPPSSVYRMQSLNESRNQNLL